jgi:hypothetical protein
VKTTENDPREGHAETHLCVGKACGLSTKLFDRELASCECILARGSNKYWAERELPTTLEKIVNMAVCIL